MTQFQVAELYEKAFIRDATAMNAFKTCGISPFKTKFFSDSDFVVAEVIDIELNAEKEPEAI